MPPKSNKAGGKMTASKGKKALHDKSSDEYSQRRERNNIAVRRSRDKSRMKAQETVDKVTKLRMENEDLEQKVKLLSKELGVLKDLFMTHASSGACENAGGTVAVNTHALQKDHEYSAASPSTES